MKATVYRRWPSKADVAVEAVGWLADRVRDPAVHRLLTGLLVEGTLDPDLRADLRAGVRGPHLAALTERWQVALPAADLAFDVVVGTLLQHASTAGEVDDVTVAAVAGLAAHLLSPAEP